MSEALHDALQPAIVRWTMGGAAASLAPEALRTHLGDDPEEAELRLLAFAGQALGMMVVPEPSGEFEEQPDLPTLSMPTLPAGLRPSAARVLASTEYGMSEGMLRLLHARGRVAHPGDWMPTAEQDVPTVYAPWQDWIAGIRRSGASTVDPALQWDDLGNAGRRALLVDLRRRDPSMALALIMEKAPEETAEQRIRMIETLSDGLSTGDRPYLESLSQDRAPRIRALASRMLARLGSSGPSGTADRDAADEMRGFLRIETRGMVNRRKVIEPARHASHAENLRRTNALSSMNAAAVAAAIGVQDVELAAMWPWGREQTMDRQFTAMLLGTGSQRVVESYEAVVARGAPITPYTLGEDSGRLSAAALSRIAQKSMDDGTHPITIMGNLTMPGIIDSYQSSAHWRRVLAELKADVGVTAKVGSSELLAMGLIVTKRAAAEILATLSGIGMTSADPRLDTLRINASL